MTIALVTDSTSDLSPELAQRYAVRSVPLTVLFDGKSYRDGIDISTAELIEGIRAGKKIPSTSQPSPAEFAAVYREALQEADEVLSLHISGQLSGTVGSARLAAQEFGNRVTVVDSRSATMGLGLRVIHAAELAQQGKSMAEIVPLVDKAAQVADIRFTVESLDFLKANGRIGGAAALLGGLLKITPILAVREGRVDSAAKVRGHNKALQEIVGSARRFIQEQGQVRVAFMSTPGGEPYVEILRDGLAGMPFDDIGNHGIGAVIGTHTGPGTVGVILEPMAV